MAHRVLITMDDLEAAVRLNAAFEAAGFETAMVSAQDDARATVAREDPDLVVVTGGLHEATAAKVLGTVRDGRAATLALLEPTDQLRKYERSGDFTSRLAMLEEMKTLPLGAVWDYYCVKQNVPVGPAWIGEVKTYEETVLSKR
jgi:CheY-like chemotaxis protein